MPPLKFHSGLLAPHSHAFVASGLKDAESDESIDSVSDCEDGNFSDEEVSGSNNFDYLERPISQCYDEEELFGYKVAKPKPKPEGRYGILKNGLSNGNLTIEVPSSSARRFTDGEIGYRKCAQNQKIFTPIGGSQLLKQVQMRKVNSLSEPTELGTPSAPPIIDVDVSEQRDSEGLVTNEQTPNEPWLSRESEDYDGRSVSSHGWMSKTRNATEISEGLVVNEQTPNGSWPSRESVDCDGKSVSSHEWKTSNVKASEMSER